MGRPSGVTTPTATARYGLSPRNCLSDSSTSGFGLPAKVFVVLINTEPRAMSHGRRLDCRIELFYNVFSTEESSDDVSPITIGEFRRAHRQQMMAVGQKIGVG